MIFLALLPSGGGIHALPLGAWEAFVTALMSRMQWKWCCMRSKAAFGKSLRCLQASHRTVPQGGREEKCPRSPSCLNLPSSSTRPVSEENFETTHIQPLSDSNCVRDPEGSVSLLLGPNPGSQLRCFNRPRQPQAESQGVPALPMCPP